MGVQRAKPLAARRNERNPNAKKDQEGRPNSPVDCLAVGNPIKGFPAKSQGGHGPARELNGMFRESGGRTQFAPTIPFCFI